MSTTITWHGHNCWSIETAGSTILLDPFLNDSPTAPLKADAVQADFILLSHGHDDHLGDTVAIAKRTGATVLANFEVSEWLKKKGLAGDKVIGMNPGGGIRQPFGHVKFTIAHHSSSLPDGSYGGVPGGFLLALAEARVYFACDTALFLDMKHAGRGHLGRTRTFSHSRRTHRVETGRQNPAIITPLSLVTVGRHNDGSFRLNLRVYREDFSCESIAS
jgi:L-ascorbate metabolism protein UlaG (beta-lactamase superfamily)